MMRMKQQAQGAGAGTSAAAEAGTSSTSAEGAAAPAPGGPENIAQVRGRCFLATYCCIMPVPSCATCTCTLNRHGLCGAAALLPIGSCLCLTLTGPIQGAHTAAHFHRAITAEETPPFLMRPTSLALISTLLNNTFAGPAEHRDHHRGGEGGKDGGADGGAVGAAGHAAQAPEEEPRAGICRRQGVTLVSHMDSPALAMGMALRALARSCLMLPL